MHFKIPGTKSLWAMYLLEVMYVNIKQWSSQSKYIKDCKIVVKFKIALFLRSEQSVFYLWVVRLPFSGVLLCVCVVLLKHLPNIWFAAMYKKRHLFYCVVTFEYQWFTVNSSFMCLHHLAPQGGVNSISDSKLPRKWWLIVLLCVALSKVCSTYQLFLYVLFFYFICDLFIFN